LNEKIPQLYASGGKAAWRSLVRVNAKAVLGKKKPKHGSHSLYHDSV
jgi:hypothetical protein